MHNVGSSNMQKLSGAKTPFNRDWYFNEIISSSGSHHAKHQKRYSFRKCAHQGPGRRKYLGLEHSATRLVETVWFDRESLIWVDTMLSRVISCSVCMCLIRKFFSQPTQPYAESRTRSLCNKTETKRYIHKLNCSFFLNNFLLVNFFLFLDMK